jgi:multiple sugar transport system substrate-binding protein
LTFHKTAEITEETTMRKFTRRETLGLGVGAAALVSGLGRGARAAIPVADVAAPQFEIEDGAELRVLRPAKFVPADEEYFNKNTAKFTETTGIRSRSTIRRGRTCGRRRR